MSRVLSEKSAALSAEVYLSLLASKTMGRQPAFMAETPSTNDWIAARLAEPGIERMVAAAERQTHGRGRMGRRWESPEGVNLAFSLAWPAPEELRQPGVITLAAGLALAEAAEALGLTGAALKYPNDLLLGGRKAGGILTELKRGGSGKYAVIGVGLNVNADQEALGPDLAESATSFFIYTGKKYERERALAQFINLLEPALELLANGGLKDIMYRYRRLAAPTFGKVAAVTGPGGGFTGVAEGVTGEGELMIRTSDGKLKLALSGEVTFKDLERAK